MSKYRNEDGTYMVHLVGGPAHDVEGESFIAVRLDILGIESVDKLMEISSVIMRTLIARGYTTEEHVVSNSVGLLNVTIKNHDN